MGTLWFWIGIGCVAAVVVYQLGYQVYREIEKDGVSGLVILSLLIQLVLVGGGLVSLYMSTGHAAKEVNTRLHTDTTYKPVKETSPEALEEQRKEERKATTKAETETHRKEVEDEAANMKDFLKDIETRRE